METEVEAKSNSVRRSPNDNNLYTVKLSRSAKRKLICCCGSIILVCLSLIGFGIGYGLAGRRDERRPRAVGAVASDHLACSDVGRDILLEGGSAVDAAIAALLCNGVRQPHSMGIGGGCFMVIYKKNNNEVDVINGRETAPAAATQQRYANQSISHGPLSIGVPGELKAYWAAHKKHGLLPWKRLFQPAITMAREGHPLSSATGRVLKRLREVYKFNFTEYAHFCSVFCDDHSEPLKAGQRVVMSRLAKTLEGIAEQGPDFIYKNQNGADFVKDIQDFGGLVTLADLDEYSPRLEEALQMTYDDVTMYTVKAPSGGPVLTLILNIIEGFHFTHDDIATPEAEAATYHKIIEAIKFSMADRFKLGDPQHVDVNHLLTKMISKEYADYLREKINVKQTQNIDYYTNLTKWTNKIFGTSHLSVLAPNGDAVSVTSTLNWYFGSFLLSPSTGIILNNEMADFSKPSPESSSPNLITPGKQPLSSMTPTVMVDKAGFPVLVVGAAGGDRITAVNAQVIIRILWLKQKLAEAIDAKRFHHRLIPNILLWEPGFDEGILNRLSQYGHRLKEDKPKSSVVQGISRNSNTGDISAVSDHRKGGKASFVYT